MREPITDQTPNEADMACGHQKALELIQRQRTMVLATHMGQAPWAAPVYYAYLAPGFYFFSAPHALHIRQAMEAPLSAAAIYADGDDLDQIEGVQMTGHIAQVVKATEKLKATQHFLAKLPLAKSLLSDTGTAVERAKNTHLYRFVPETTYYMDNRTRFAQRLEIQLSTSKETGDTKAAQRRKM